MRSIFNFGIILIVCLSMLSCKNDEKKKGEVQLDQLTGDWENTTDQGYWIESWRKQSDSVYKGISHVIQGRDTVFTELLEIKIRKDGTFYIPTIPSENKEPVWFRLISNQNQLLLFENRKHDFPNIISYDFSNEGEIMASITGKIDGKNKTELFPMKKKK